MFYVIDLKNIKKFIMFALAVAIICVGCYTALKRIFPLRHYPVIEKYSEQYGLDKTLVCALIHAESRFDKDAVSSKGASGLMQLMRQTADWGAEGIGILNYSYKRIFEPEINVQLGCWYLSKLITQYGGNVETALAAYNAGSGNVAKWLGDKSYSSDGESLTGIPFPQTESYIKKIEKNRVIYKYIIRVFGGTYE